MRDTVQKMNSYKGAEILSPYTTHKHKVFAELFAKSDSLGLLTKMRRTQKK